MIFFIGMGVGLFPHTNLCGSTNSVLARHRFYSYIQKNKKEEKIILIIFSSFLKIIYIKTYSFKTISSAAFL